MDTDEATPPHELDALARALLRSADREGSRLAFLRAVSRALLRFTGAREIDLWFDGRERIHHWRAERAGGSEHLGTFPPPAGRRAPSGDGPSTADLLRGVLAALEAEGREPGEEARSTPAGSLWRGDTALVPFEIDRAGAGVLRLAGLSPDDLDPGRVESLEGLAGMLGVAIAHRRNRAALVERVKELTCLYRIAQLEAEGGLTLPETLQEIAELLPPAWQHPEIATARITVDDRAFSSPGFLSGPHRLAAGITVRGEVRGRVEVFYAPPEGEPDRGRLLEDEPFLPEERHLIDGVAREVGLILARRGAEEEKEELRRALERLAPRRAGRPARGAGAGRHGLLGESEPMLELYAKIERAARSRATVLVSGESGTGKELVARAIHYAGDRAAAPFVPVNCGAIPHDLLESELFGHVKGAFTGATEARAGFFLTADGGTIFLDEIGETSAAMQVKLLRVLQDGEVSMVGSARSRQVDVRIIAASNKDLGKLVQRGAFREDLFFRVHVVAIEVPPLRERGADVALLAHHFAEKFAGELGREPLGFTQDALDVLRDYAWPGNVRELENLVQRLAVMTDSDTVDAADLPALMRSSATPSAGDPRRSLAEVTAEHVRRVLESVGGNKSRAARILGIDRKTLRARLEEAGGGEE